MAEFPQRPQRSRFKLAHSRIYVTVAAFVVILVIVAWRTRLPLSRQADIPVFDSRQTRSHQLNWRLCLNTKQQPGFYELGGLLKNWTLSTDPRCRELLEKFDEIYQFEWRVGTVTVEDQFRAKVSGWLQHDEKLLKELGHQVIFSLFNKYTHESTLFSKLRSKRPGLSGGVDPWQFAKKLVDDTEASCDFCRYKTMTAMDSFGRLESEHAVAVSNVFKYEAYHGLILLKRHHPLSFTEVEFMDMMSLMMKWYTKGHAARPEFKYPNLNWDMLPRASASQIHPHGQAALAPNHHYGLMEHIRLNAVQYAHRHGQRVNYFTTLRELHNVFGLSVTVGDASAIAYLTPKKDFEIIVISAKPGDDFFRLVFHTLRTFLDDLKLVAYSMGMYLPPVDRWTAPIGEDIPAVARVISRGDVSSTRSDISAMELFGASQVNQDPFKVMNALRRRLELAQLNPT